MRIPKFYCTSCGEFKNRFQVFSNQSFTGDVYYKCKRCHSTVCRSKDIIENYLSKEYVTKHEFECFNTDPYIIDKLDKHIVALVKAMESQPKTIVPEDKDQTYDILTLNSAIITLANYALMTLPQMPDFKTMQKSIKVVLTTLAQTGHLELLPGTIALLWGEIGQIKDYMEKGPIDHDEPFR